MRLWSIHPSYLDSKGLVALWREGLLAKAVLEGKTKGYKFHPQLDRFKQTSLPVAELNEYLCHVAEEASRRGYKFNTSKLLSTPDNLTNCTPLIVTKGQIEYEWNWLNEKLKTRNPEKFKENLKLKDTYGLYVHPMFEVIDGTIEPWEKI